MDAIQLLIDKENVEVEYFFSHGTHTKLNTDTYTKPQINR